METLRLDPISRIDGEIYLPGSKSLSNRALLLAAMAEGVSEITNLLDSDDVRHMLNALREIGVKFELSNDGTSCVVTGVGGALTDGGKHELYLGNAGTAMRPLTAALCMGRGEFWMTGEPRMEERPIDALVDAMRQGGCKIEYLKTEGFPPLRINADGFSGGSIEIDGSISSQFLTSLLMAAPMAREDVEIHIIGDLVSKPYIDITVDAMEKFGVEVRNNDYRVFTIAAGYNYQSPGRFLVEGDASSASYFLAAAAIKGGRVTVHGIGKASIQGDIHFADVLEKMGACVEWTDDSITVSRGELNAVDMDMNHIPDAAMTIATTALFAKGTTVIRNIYNWRVKETDRIAAMANELRKVGAEVVEGRDFIEITPPTVIEHGVIETYNDHRMAMCFSLLALDPASVTINDPRCTAKTFPDYFEKLESVSIR